MQLFIQMQKFSKISTYSILIKYWLNINFIKYWTNINLSILDYFNVFYFLDQRKKRKKKKKIANLEGEKPGIFDLFDLRNIVL